MRRILLCLLLMPALGACSASPPSIYDPVPVNAKAIDLVPFEKYIKTKPTPEAFRLKYPNVTLVLPGDIASREFRLDRSRYFAELDAEGRVVGGRFQ